MTSAESLPGTVGPPWGAAPVAYFSMEVALDPDVPTYAGGLGVLAGDLLRTAADLGVPMIGVSLVHRRGYLMQRLDALGRQTGEPTYWSPEERLTVLDPGCQVTLEGRPVALRAWRYDLRGWAGHVVPVILLDTDVPDNDPDARRLTDELYGGDDRHRLSQEALLGIGGVRILRALGYRDVRRFHLNEGHSALLALALFAEELTLTPGRPGAAIERVKRMCVFTTHTPVPTGHDQFPLDLAEKVLGRDSIAALRDLGCCHDRLNMTRVALHLSHWVNGVTRRHGEVSSSMFPDYHVSSITNGVRSESWTSPPFQALFDRYIPDWRRSYFMLRYADHIPLEEVAAAHRAAKRMLVDAVGTQAGKTLDPEAFTIGFARRATPYKRPLLVFHDAERLRALARRHGPLQLVFAGKAHPRDEAGQALIAKVFEWARILASDVRIVYLPDYGLRQALLVTAGVDLWLNTPRPPLEASGTSGMKAAHNGVPSLSVLDGWWWEGHVPGITGWAVGPTEAGVQPERDDAADAAEIYERLETEVLPAWREPVRWAGIMRSTVAINASFFNTHRMLGEYVMRAYQGEE
jgi:starch phosphorylase